MATMAREIGSKEWAFEDYEDYINWWRKFKATIDTGLGVTTNQH